MKLTRRTVLRGLGATAALPWLEQMSIAATAFKPPVRLAVLWMPNGVREDTWTPAGTGTDFTLSETLSPLAPYRRQLVIPTNLWNAGSKSGDGHYVKASGFLTSTTITKTQGVDISCNGVSMDQVAAKRLGDRTPLPSLELGTAPVTTGVDTNVGYTRVYGSHISWSGPTSPLAKEIDPQLVYERLFRATNPKPAGANEDLLLLDLVHQDAAQLRTQLGNADQQRLDEYLDTVRSLEIRLQKTRSPKQTAWKPRASIDPKARPEAMPKAHADEVKLMLDMIAVAFQTDSTRICTFMFGNAVSNENFSFVPGVKEGHHSVSHHQNDADKLRQYQLINHWHVAQYAYLLNKLAGMREGEKSVLDNSMIVLGAALRDGNKHDPHNLPIVVAGSAGGRLQTGQHLEFPKDTPLANLWLTLLDAFGAPVTGFSDSTGPLAGVLKS